MSTPGPITIPAPEPVLTLLDRLHTLSEAQEATLELRAIPPEQFSAVLAHQFVALERDKCAFVYHLARAMGATTIVEAGTSYGVSTIYLALAARSNAIITGVDPLVIGTEHELAKVAQAHTYWREAGVDGIIDLREGDLRETLAREIPTVDLLLLDIWAPMALPALKLVQPHLRRGAVVIVDNTISSKDRYRDLLAYTREPASGFDTVTLPYSGGLDMIVYNPQAE